MPRTLELSGLLTVLFACGCSNTVEPECVERCQGACVDPCPEALFRDANTCDCEPGCGAGREWVDDECVPIGGDSDVDSDSDTGSGTDSCGTDTAGLGCGPKALPECEDEDGDGYDPDGLYCYPPFDCDDTNDAIHPGAQETCDHVDEDCDHRVDENLPDCA